MQYESSCEMVGAKTIAKGDVLPRLLADLVSCAIAPGSPIGEKQTCTHYGVSRTPLREALVALSERGFVTLEPNKGAFAAAIDQASIFRIYEARIPLEKSAAALAALRASDNQCELLQELRKQVRDTVNAGDMQRYHDIEQHLFDLITEASGNGLLQDLLTNLRAHTLRVWTFYRDRGLSEKPDASNLGSLAYAVSRRDASGAASAVYEHLNQHLKACEQIIWKPVSALRDV